MRVDLEKKRTREMKAMRVDFEKKLARQWETRLNESNAREL